MDFFDVNGVRLAAEVTGAAGARPLVLLHGGGRDKSTWAEIAPAFAGTHRVYAVDLRGFGDSDRPGSYSFTQLRDDVLGLLDLLGADRVDLIGHSMGGTVAWLVAQARPGRVGRLVIVDSPPPKAGGEPIVLGARPEPEPPFDWDAIVAVIGDLNDPDPSWWDRIGDVTAPTLLLAGGAGSHVPQHLLTEALADLKDGRLVEIPVGHNLHTDAPERFLAEVVPFLTTTA